MQVTASRDNACYQTEHNIREQATYPIRESYVYDV